MRDRRLETLRQQDGDAVAAGDAEPGKRIGQPVRSFRQLAAGQRLRLPSDQSMIAGASGVLSAGVSAQATPILKRSGMSQRKRETRSS
jgi:hypothetical protein